MISPELLIQNFGYVGMFVIVLVETGLLVGFFLPGDSLLLLAGTLAAANKLSLPLSMLVFVLGSFLGDQIGYWVGRRFGQQVFNRPQSRFFDPENVSKAKAFLDKYGALAIIIARFVPVIRAFSPTMAGVTKLSYPSFLGLSAIGAVAWGVGITALGYFLGQLIPDLEKYIYLILAVGILAGVVPSAMHLLRPAKKD